jgi:hypothetical protein
MGVHAPDIKEEFEEFKEFEEFWRGAALAACTKKPAISAVWHNRTGNRRQAGGSRELRGVW